MDTKSFYKLLLLLSFASALFFTPSAIAIGEEQTLIVESMEENSIVINVQDITDDNTSYYIAYKASDLSEISKVQSDGTGKIELDIANGTTFSVSSYDNDNQKIAFSSLITVYTDPTSLESITLKNDTYVKELTLTEGEIDINGKTLFVFEDAVLDSDLEVNKGSFSVMGSLIHSDGTLTIGNGTVNVKGDYKIIDYEDNGVSHGKLQMTEVKDRLNVDGDFVTDSLFPHTGCLTNGVFRLKGNFSQKNTEGHFMTSRNNFDTENNFKIIFCGNDTQTVYFHDPKRSQFAIWEVENESEKPMEITNGFGIRTLKQDSVIPCDVEVWSHLYTDKVASSIDLNGYTLHIKGDLINNRVNMRIGRGRLIVEGDYKLQIFKASGKYSGYRWTYGTLRMLYAEDYVLVMGDFMQDSYYSHSKCMVAGTLEVKGDFRQITTNFRQDTHYNFDASGTHRVILSGDGIQIVDFEDPDKNQFNILEIPADDKPGHIIMFTSEWRANETINNSTMTALLNWTE